MAATLCAWKSGRGSVAEICGNLAWTNALPFVTLGFSSASRRASIKLRDDAASDT